MPTTMSQAIAAVRNMFEQEGWRYQFDEERFLFSTTFSIKKSKLGSVNIRILVRPSKADPNICYRISSYGTVGLKADDECMSQMCEYLMRANFGMVFGNFELDFDDGEVLFKASYNVRDALPGADALDDLISLQTAMFRRYGNGMLAVSMGLMSPEEAIRRAESE